MIAVSIALSLLMLSSGAAPEPQWTLEKERDGVKVYLASKPSSGFKAFKAVTTIQASPQAVIGVLQQVTGYADWFAYAETVTLIETSPNAKFVYMETKFPWPFSNEDMIYRITQSTSGATTRFRLMGVPEHQPPKSGINRMKRADGYIEVTPLGDATKVTYVMHSELAGRIPVWMANQNIHELPIRTLAGLKDIVLHRSRFEHRPPPAPSKPRP